MQIAHDTNNVTDETGRTTVKRIYLYTSQICMAFYGKGHASGAVIVNAVSKINFLGFPQTYSDHG